MGFRKILYITDECVFCGMCIEVCPKKCIKADFDGYEMYLIEPDQCNKCKGFSEDHLCQENCPVYAIIEKDDD